MNGHRFTHSLVGASLRIGIGLNLQQLSRCSAVRRYVCPVTVPVSDHFQGNAKGLA